MLYEKNLVIPLNEIRLDNKLHFSEDPTEIIDHDVKELKQSRILIVKVHWKLRQGPEFTWEREHQFRSMHPHIFATTSPADVTR
ncbi:hypothetical protein Tco_0025349, partial [Tanacetum coccineum]